MVDFATIEQTLTYLDNEYNNCLDPKFQTLLSKVAMLEFCGWIEVAMDEVLFEYLNRINLEQKLLEAVKKRIDENWGFHFSSNIQPLFCYILGVVNWQTVLSDLDNINKREVLISTLNNFSKRRGVAAHTNIQVTQSYDAPCTIKNNFCNIKDAIKQMQSTIISL